MNLIRTWQIFRKDLAIGPRSPLLIFMLLIPLLMALIMQLVFGALVTSQPRLAYVDEGNSELRLRLEALPGTRVSRLDSAQLLLRAVEANDHDGGIILPAGFDQALRSGGKPPLKLYFSGESYAMNRLIVVVSILDLVRALEGRQPPVTVELVKLEEGPPQPLHVRFIPVIIFFSFALAGIFAPASMLVDEKVQRTLTAVLATPASMKEILLGKGLVGVVLSFALALVSLLLNGVRVGDFGGLLVVLLVVSVFWSCLGLIIGLLARNPEMLFAVVKGAGAFFFGPAVFYIFPDWPQWIARMFPSFWAIDPLWQLIANDAELADVLPSLAIVAGMCLLAIPAILALSRRTVSQLA